MDNLGIIVRILILVLVVGTGVYEFYKLGKEKQVSKIKEWLLFAVLEAEKALGGGTGKVKLRYVYDMFIDKFKFMTVLVSFEEFSTMVDETLEIMRDMLATNEKVKEYIDNEN